MFRIRPRWLAAAVVVGAGAPPAAAEPPPTTLAAKWFGPSKPKPKPGPDPRGGTGAALRPPTVAAPLPTEVVAGALRAEQDAWERRMSVCLKLRQVALDANDEALMRQVDDLERQATAVYNTRVAALGVPKVTPSATASARRPDPAEVSKYDATGAGTRMAAGDVKAAADRLTAPAAPTATDPAVRTAEARTPADVVREVGP